MDTLLLTKGLAALILPPGAILVLLAAGLVLRRWRPRLGAGLVVLAAAALYALSTGPVAGLLVQRVESTPPVAPGDHRLSGYQAIVVLGGGRRDFAPELGGPTVSGRALERLRYAAFLQRRTGLPLAVTGGTVFGDGPAEGELMAQSLARDFGVPVRWVESASRNTEENARFSRDVLAADGIRRIVLVSHANHLGRAVPMFRDQGFEVLPAPTAFAGGPHDAPHPLDWFPSAGTFAQSRDALHELLGRLWYALRRE